MVFTPTQKLQNYASSFSLPTFKTARFCGFQINNSVHFVPLPRFEPLSCGYPCVCSCHIPQRLFIQSTGMMKWVFNADVVIARHSLPTSLILSIVFHCLQYKGHTMLSPTSVSFQMLGHLNRMIAPLFPGYRPIHSSDLA